MPNRCPGQDLRFWKIEDIFTVSCQQCGYEMEFFKDDIRLACRGCGIEIMNPRIDQGCAQWCKHAGECQGDQ